MKTFTYPKHKWAMTGALLMALGFSVSFNSHSKEGLASIDFSSEAPADEGAIKGKSSKIYTSKGAIPVKYIDNGEDKVLAIIPKKMTEGKVCDTCGFETIPLNTKNKEDLDSLNVALMKAIETKLTEKNEQTEKSSKDASEKDKSKDEEDKKKVDYFARIDKACKSKSKKLDASEKMDELKCHSEEFKKLLSDEKISEEIDAKEASDYYRKKIQPLFVRQIADVRKTVARQSMAYGPQRAFQVSEEFGETPEESLRTIYAEMGDLVAELPSKFERIREQLVSGQSQILKYEASIMKEAYDRAMTKDISPSDFQLATNDYNTRWTQLNLMKNLTQSEMVDALRSAHYGDNISTSLQVSYENYIQKMLLELQNNALTGSGTKPTVDMSARLAAPQRGTVIVNPGNASGGTLGGRTQQNSTLIPLAPRAPRQ